MQNLVDCRAAVVKPDAPADADVAPGLISACSSELVGRSPGAAGTPRLRMNRTRSNRPAWDAAPCRSLCSHRRTGMHLSASFPSLRSRSVDR